MMSGVIEQRIFYIEFPFESDRRSEKQRGNKLIHQKITAAKTVSKKMRGARLTCGGDNPMVGFLCRSYTSFWHRFIFSLFEKPSAVNRNYYIF